MMSRSPSREQYSKKRDMHLHEDNDLLADYFEKSASAVRHTFARFEGDIARPLMNNLMMSFRERPVTSTFIGIYVALSALPVLSFIGLSTFVFATFTFLALAVATLSASAVVGFFGFWLLCALLLFLVGASILTLGALSTFVLLRFLLHARQDGPRTALFELVDDARTQYALARGRQPGPGPDQSQESVVKQEQPGSDFVVTVGLGTDAQKESQVFGPGFGAPGVPVDAPA